MLSDQHFQPEPFRIWLLQLSPLLLFWYDSTTASLHPLALEPCTPMQIRELFPTAAKAVFLKPSQAHLAKQGTAPTPPEWILLYDADTQRHVILHTTTPAFASALDAQTFAVMPPIADHPPMEQHDLERWLPAAFDACTILLKQAADTLPQLLDSTAATT
jgi:hypothetical protein